MHLDAGTDDEFAIVCNSSEQGFRSSARHAGDLNRKALPSRNDAASLSKLGSRGIIIVMVEWSIPVGVTN